MTAAVTDMTSNNAHHRARGATTMGWNAGPCGFIGGAGAITDPMAIWWESASLHSNAQIVANVAARIQRQRQQIATMFGI
ncbi:MAG TPA: hypothetical protein VGX49_16310 [Jatrophihabitans sp.]|nr:hypothetical protein [Jatrophihabitans sp.]